MPDVLSRRALNRATMARQLLLERHALGPLAAVAHLVGLQAQIPAIRTSRCGRGSPGSTPTSSVATWSNGELVRIVVMRATIHLVTADDALTLRPLTQPVLTAELRRHRDHAPHLRDLDLGPLMADAAAAMAERPLTTRSSAAALGRRSPALDAPSLAYAARRLLPLVQVPPRGVWGRRGR